ncbi:hypothetical protein [Oceanirhabdus sp. W0125-5]|uniref:hypothetical protein n=1 Tax=Oceanirhabdus sp. W0125-5 TaxID=2999116 RepID=UPI0022F2BCF2|nr:hypothetical protein [Oceanirhabdus sp. W0125-5]WBW97531.1 hypothetical protein OW730_01555 [Oceanirhabdus sp. W0125-5]
MLFNNKDSKLMNIINKIILIGMVLIFIVAIPKYSYKSSVKSILSTRFKNESVKVIKTKHKDKKIKSMNRPSFFTGYFYKVKVSDLSGKIHTFYMNPETGKWGEITKEK